MKKCFLTLYVLFLMQFCFSQDGYMDGYIITRSGDTIQGKIKDRKYPNGPGESDKIRFIDANGKESKKTPDEIKAYCKKGIMSFRSLPIGADGKQKFAEILEYGTVILFGFTNDSFIASISKSTNSKDKAEKSTLPLGIEYFFQKQNDTRSLMKVRPKEFESTASFYFQNDVELKTKIENGALKYQDIRLVVKTYNDFAGNK
jgi:hypothetical protein